MKTPEQETGRNTNSWGLVSMETAVMTLHKSVVVTATKVTTLYRSVVLMATSLHLVLL